MLGRGMKALPTLNKKKNNSNPYTFKSRLSFICSEVRQTPVHISRRSYPMNFFYNNFALQLYIYKYIYTYIYLHTDI